MRRALFSLTLIAVFTVAGLAQTRRPNTNVQRERGATPEVSSARPAKIENGKATEVVVTGKDFPANGKLSVSGECKLVKASQTGTTEARFTVISVSDNGGNCYLEISGGGRSATADVDIEPTAAVAAKRAQERKEYEAKEAERQKKEMAEGQKTIDYMQNTAPELVGKKWSVILPNGKPDTWTWTEKSMGGGKFKSSTGVDIMIMMQPGEKLTVMAGQGCVFSGTLAGGKVADGKADLPANICKLGQGKWTATVSK